MGVDSYENGFKKLWKLLSNLDLMISKVTELEIIQFLKYNEGFEEITTDSPNGDRIIQSIAKTGFSPSNFHLSQLTLERYQELFATASGLKRQNVSSNSSRVHLKETKDNANDLIEELRN